MLPMSTRFCDCCGLSIDPRIRDDCPRCGYPVDVAKERHFLEASLHDLSRVAQYGGENLTVKTLIARYRLRLGYLRQLAATPVVAEKPSVSPVTPLIEQKTQPLKPLVVRPITLREMEAASSVVPPVVEQKAAPAHVFSLKSFFADQPINIVASLGAFLILIGALSFVATTTSLLLSFLALFLVHAVFGVIGIASYRFRSFRTVAAIYTAIFALLVPLVDFSGYRLVAGNIIPLSTAVLVALAAVYAALVYGGLAVYQKFKPFGYLAVTALMVVDLALAFALKLDVWWWPSMLLLLALVSLISVLPGNAGLFNSAGAILREPVRVLMRLCVGVGYVALVLLLFSSLLLGAFRDAPQSIRLALLCTVLLVLVWTCLYMWLTKRVQWAPVLCYLFLSAVLILCYVLNFQAIGYVLTLTGVALLYHGLKRFAPRLLLPLGKLSTHMEGVALLLVFVVPFVGAPSLPLQLFIKAYASGMVVTPLSMAEIATAISLLVGTVLTVSVMLGHIGRSRLVFMDRVLGGEANTVAGFQNGRPQGSPPPIPAAPAPTGTSEVLGIGGAFGNGRPKGPLPTSTAAPAPTGTSGLPVSTKEAVMGGIPVSTKEAVFDGRVLWGWLLLLGGFLLNYAWGLVTLSLPIEPVWSFLVLALLLVVGAVSVRRVVGDAWANPLDVVAVSTVILTMLLSGNQGVDTIMLLLFFFAALSYGVLLYQRRNVWLFVPFVFMLCALPLVVSRPHLMLCVIVLLPLLMVVVHSGFTRRMVANAVNKVGARRFMGVWEWPLLASALLYSVVFFFYELPLPVSTLQQWIGIGFPVALELALVGLVWYVSAVLACVKWWLSIATGFAIVALLIPTNSISVLLWLAPLAAIGAFIVGRIYERAWAVPFYVVGLLAAGMFGVLGYAHGQYPTVSLALLAFALLIYLLGVLENLTLFLWLAPCYAVGSVCYAVLVGDFYPLPVVALVCAALGIGISCLKYPFPILVSSGNKVLRFSLPFYMTALVAIIIGTVWISTASAALPTSLVYGTLYLFIALGVLVMLVERSPGMLIVPVALALVVIAQFHWVLWLQMLACSVLFALVFATQFVWYVLPAATKLFSPARVHQVLGLSGVTCVILVIIAHGGLFAGSGLLTHVGAGSLLLLSGLLLWYGQLQPVQPTRRRCYYAVGLLVSLVISWELSAFQFTRIDILSLAPATYLVVIAPFLARDDTLTERHRLGQLCSIAGAALLLLPTLWSSFSNDNLQPTLTLAAEALLLFLLGVGTRVRVFMLSGAGLVIISAMHALFLPSLGIPPFLALAILGITLLVIATALKLASSRIRVLWKEAE